jgi:hypothetical protein
MFGLLSAGRTPGGRIARRTSRQYGLYGDVEGGLGKSTSAAHGAPAKRRDERFVDDVLGQLEVARAENACED